MDKFHFPLYSGGVFHVLSHAVGNELLFRNDENYRFFLQRYNKYVTPIADTLSFCLLPNHFHFMIRIKSEVLIEAHYRKKKPEKDFDATIAPDFVMECFSNFLNSYSKAYNKMFRRMGALFIDYLRRVEVKSDGQFGSTIFYVHRNPLHHGLCESITDWYWTSYKTFLSKSPSMILRDEVLEWFGGVEQFILYHNQPIYLKRAAGLE